MRATKRSVATIISAVTAFAGAALLAGGPASAVVTPVQSQTTAQSNNGSAADQFEKLADDPAAKAGTNVLGPGETLGSGEYIKSGNGEYGLAQLENGELVFGRFEGKKVLFSTQTQNNPGAVTRMNKDGNLVVLDPDTKKAIWASNTSGSPDNWLQVQDDGELAIYGQDGKLDWTSHNLVSKLHAGQKLTNDTYVSSKNREYHLLMQKPGNLVLYNKDRQAVWANAEDGVEGSYAVLQHDGNLVIKNPETGEAVWASNTAGSGGNVLVVSNDGELVIQDDQENVVWSAETK